eukprot:gene16037-22175_t
MQPSRQNEGLGTPIVTTGDGTKSYSSDYSMPKCKGGRIIDLAKLLLQRIQLGVSPDGDATVGRDKHFLDHYDPLCMGIIGQHGLLSGVPVCPDSFHALLLRGILQTTNTLLSAKHLDDDINSDQHLSVILSELLGPWLADPKQGVHHTACFKSGLSYTAEVQILLTSLPAFLRDAPTALQAFAVHGLYSKTVKCGAPYLSPILSTEHSLRVRFTCKLLRTKLWAGKGDPSNEQVLRMALRAFILRAVVPEMLMHGLYTKAFHYGGSPVLEIQSPGEPVKEGTEKRLREGGTAEGERSPKQPAVLADPMDLGNAVATTSTHDGTPTAGTAVTTPGAPQVVGHAASRTPQQQLTPDPKH